jgi:hypothetical protein
LRKKKEPCKCKENDIILEEMTVEEGDGRGTYACISEEKL